MFAGSGRGKCALRLVSHAQATHNNNDNNDSSWLLPGLMQAPKEAGPVPLLLGEPSERPSCLLAWEVTDAWPTWPLPAGAGLVRSRAGLAMRPEKCWPAWWLMSPCPWKTWTGPEKTPPFYNGGGWNCRNDLCPQVKSSLVTEPKRGPCVWDRGEALEPKLNS